MPRKRGRKRKKGELNEKKIPFSETSLFSWKRRVLSDASPRFRAFFKFPSYLVSEWYPVLVYSAASLRSAASSPWTGGRKTVFSSDASGMRYF